MRKIITLTILTFLSFIGSSTYATVGWAPFFIVNKTTFKVRYFLGQCYDGATCYSVVVDPGTTSNRDVIGTNINQIQLVEADNPNSSLASNCKVQFDRGKLGDDKSPLYITVIPPNPGQDMGNNKGQCYSTITPAYTVTVKNNSSRAINLGTGTTLQAGDSVDLSLFPSSSSSSTSYNLSYALPSGANRQLGTFVIRSKKELGAYPEVTLEENQVNLQQANRVAFTLTNQSSLAENADGSYGTDIAQQANAGNTKPTLSGNCKEKNTAQDIMCTLVTTSGQGTLIISDDPAAAPKNYTCDMGEWKADTVYNKVSSCSVSASEKSKGTQTASEFYPRVTYQKNEYVACWYSQGETPTEGGAWKRYDPLQKACG